MIDIHSHIIFGVDDGPKTLEESLALLQMAYDQGVRHIVATSHRRKGMFETPEGQILTNYGQVKQAASQKFPDLTLYYGGELYYTPDMADKLEQGAVPTMNGTRFALIEFSSMTPYKDIHNAVNKILLLGITPIVAHIERYNALEFEANKVKELINMGAYMQVNASHVLKPKLLGDKLKIYKKRAKFFLEENLVHVIASDMHNTGERQPQMRKAYEVVEDVYGTRRAQALFETHPQTLLENNYI